jgi:inhibitor of KinA
MMNIFPLGDNALTIDFGNIISAELNDKVLQLQAYINKNTFAGMIETVAAFSSLTVFYDVAAVKKQRELSTTSFEFVKKFVESAINNLEVSIDKPTRLIKIPLIVNLHDSPDLEFVAQHANLTTAQVIKLFTQQTYRVFMLGFLPAFAYMGEVDAKIAVPRKQSPRLKVPKGSIGIAGQQTGIYPFDSPGGWQIIGKTNVEMFTPNAETPSYLQTGDIVQFVVET